MKDKVSDTFSQETLDALGLETDVGLSISRLQSSTPLYNLNQAFLDLFRGVPPPPTGKLYSALNIQQRQQLSKIGIELGEEKIFVGGLVTTPTRNGRPLCLETGKNILDTAASVLIKTQTFWELVHRFFECHDTDTETTSEITKALQQNRREILIELARMSLPSGYTYQILHLNNFFETTGPRVGLYLITLCMETANMSFYTNSSRDLETLEDLIPHIADKTDWDAFEPDVEPDPPVTTGVSLKRLDKIRKQIKKDRKFNDYKAIEAKRQLAQRLYTDIRIKLTTADDVERNKLRAYIKSLRPPMKVLRQHYISKGDPPEIASKLVNYQSYPTLPNVWITKKHQAVLLDVIDGHSDKHDAYIKNGFKDI